MPKDIMKQMPSLKKKSKSFYEPQPLEEDANIYDESVKKTTAIGPALK